MNTIGIVGAGQLGQMLGYAAARLGLNCRFLDPSDSPPAAQAGTVIKAAFDDIDALRALARDCDVITYEFENVPVTSIRALASECPVFPPADALECAQDRIHEKQIFEVLGIEAASHRAVDSESDLAAAVESLGLPLVVKTRRFGYDGKGQAVLRAADDVGTVFADLGGSGLVAEQFVAFDREVSVIAARSVSGDIVFYPLTENVHRDGILRLSTAPAGTRTLQRQARAYVERILNEFDYVGVLALEMFERGGHLLANEFAPRVHNSGHWTIEGTTCSQFENHLRAISGMPLIAPEIIDFPAMINVIGAMPRDVTAFETAGAVLHDYGKSPRPGRKLAHATILGKSDADRRKRMDRLCRALDD